MRKILSLLLCAMLVFSLCACGQKENHAVTYAEATVLEGNRDEVIIDDGNLKLTLINFQQTAESAAVKFLLENRLGSELQIRGDMACLNIMVNGVDDSHIWKTSSKTYVKSSVESTSSSANITFNIDFKDFEEDDLISVDRLEFDFSPNISNNGANSTDSSLNYHIIVFLDGSGQNEAIPGSETNQPSSIDTATPEPIEPTSPTEQPSAPGEEIQTYDLTDGPVFFTGNKDGFSLTLYSLKTGERYNMFNFSNPNSKYTLAIDPLEDGNFFHEQLFDSKLERLAVSWRENSDSSVHVGWIDRDGNLTDVTNIIHPATSGFSGVTPSDTSALFTPDDLLIFYDWNQELYCYYDDSTKSIVETYSWDKENDPYCDMITNSKTFLGLNGENRPTTRFMMINGDYYHIDNGNFGTKGLSRDYVAYSDGVSLLEIERNSKGIAHFGKGLTDINVGLNDYDTSIINPSVRPSYYGHGAITITPPTEYIIENLAYSDGEIVFTAKRGTERVLFKMSYVDRSAGEPEQVTTIDSSWGEIFFWKD